MTGIYLFDIDGTLSDTTHRLHFIQDYVPRKWDEFYMAAADDPPITGVVDVCRSLQEMGYTIWYWTGRSDISYDITMEWLHRYVDDNIYTYPERLRMRPAVDHRHDDILKEHWLLNRTFEEDRRLIKGVFEDRTRVVNMWRRNGIKCFQVATGDF
jgi:FMN phosphatase YigB (HAD superfamily)